MGKQFFIGPNAAALLEALEKHDLRGVSALGAESLDDIFAINLEGSEAAAIPPEIGQLTNLRTLSLSVTRISALPPEIGELANLQYLYLSGTRISALPPEIGELANLLWLDLGETRISALPPEIGHLANLQYLSLTGTRISALPPEIGELANLQYLFLTRTPISALPPEIGELANLRILSLSGTPISAHPPEIGGLKALESLVFDETELASLPHFLCDLPKLRFLSFDKTRVQTIPSWIKGLRGLRCLSMNGLTLKKLPKEILDLELPFYLSKAAYQEKARSNGTTDHEKGIVMEDTVLKTQPVSLFALDRAFIQAYYDEPKLPVREGKVIFLGDGGAGKSHTIERILKNGKDEEIRTDQTPGINIKPWEPVCGDRQIRINFWDFGGQEILHAMHRCFLTGRSLYVVVLRERSQSRHNDLTLQAQYWLENIQSFAPDCPVILAVNREQGVAGTGGINSRKLREEFKSVVGEPIVYCAKEDGDDNFQALMDTIRREVLKLDSTEMEFPRAWNQVRGRLETMSNRRDREGSRYYIDQEEYQALCAEHGIPDENIRRWLLEWFNDLGVCFSYHQEDGKALERYQVLNPEWLTNAIYAIIMIGKHPEFSKNGVTTRAEVNQILSDPAKYAKERTVQAPIQYDETEQGYVLDVMKKFNLCAQINEREFFIPALCPTETPEAFRPSDGEYADHTRFEFRYSFLPDSVIHRLMIACIKAGFNRKASYFSGIRLDFEPDEIVLTVEADIAKNVLSIDVYHKNDPQTCRKKLSWVRKKVDEINTSMNLKAVREILVIFDGTNRADLRLDILFTQHERGKKKMDLPAFLEGEIVECNLDAALRLLYDDRVVNRADRIRKNLSQHEIKCYKDALAKAEAQLEEVEQRMKNGKQIDFVFGVSFAGEQREFIRDVCKTLCQDAGLSENELFFDEWHEHLINGANADVILDKIYSEHCRKVIVLLSEAYLNKHWTNKLEWRRAITTRITSDPDNVCLLRYGDLDIDSVDLLHSKKDIVKDVTNMTPQKVAEFIMNWSERPEL